MSEENENVTETASELTVLKQRADRLGITYSNNIGVDSLRKKIEEFTNPTEEAAKADLPAAIKLRHAIRADALKLIRVRIQNLDPKKAELPGEFLTVANEYIGTVKRFVPYTADANANGWHVEQCILDMMKERTFTHISFKKGHGGQQTVETRDVPEFNIAILPPLTREELDKLAQAQIAAGTISVGK